MGHRPVGPRSRDMAVVLHAGPSGALGVHSAGALWAMRRWTGVVHAIGPRSRKGDGFVIHRTRDLPPSDVTVHWGIPVTTPLRTLLDLSGHLSLDALDAALAEALVRRLVTPEELLPRARGQLRALLETAAPTRSRLERDIVLAAAGWRTVRVTDRQLHVTRAETAGRFTKLLRAPEPARAGAPR